MRTFDEIDADIKVASAQYDHAGLRTLAEEMRAHGTPEAEATALHALGIAIEYTGDYPHALEMYRQVLVMHEEQGNKVGMARAANSIGGLFILKGEFDEAHEYFRRALHLYEEIGNRAGIAKVTGNLGTLYSKTGDYAKAIEYCNRSMFLAEEIDDRSLFASGINTVGVVYQRTSDFVQALVRYHRALSIHEETGNRDGIAQVTGNIGIVYYSSRDYSSALEYFQRALDIHEQLGDRSNAARVIGNIGNCYSVTGDLPRSMEHYQQAIAMFKDLGDRAGVVYWTNVIIRALIDEENFAEAARLLEEQTSMTMENPVVRSHHFVNRARIAEHEGDLDAAHELLLHAVDIGTSAGIRDQVSGFHWRLRDLAQKRNDFAGYIEHNNEYNRITEEIRGKEATQRLTMIEAERKMEAERRERDKERALLYGALPESVATRMLRGEDVSGDHYDNAAVLFLDIVGFTAISDQLAAAQVVQFLEQIFSSLDEICKKHELTKIKTIGDSYLAVAFSEQPNNRITEQPKASNEQRAAAAALEMLDAVSKILIPNGSPEGSPERSHVSVRIGMHCGAVTAGVLGKERLQYDVWGDTVNVASRMESTGEPGKIHVSEQFASFLAAPLATLGASARNDNSSPLKSEGGPVIPRTKSEERGDSSQFPVPWSLRERGALEVKGKGTMTTFWLERSLPIQH